MKQVYKYDENGIYIEPIIIQPNENGDYELPENCTEKELHQPNWKPVFNKELNDWVETITDVELVTQYSPAKIQELNQKCEETILGRFSVELPNGTYEFSYDEKAQSRFNGTSSLFLADLITEIPWTAYLNGERVRITLNKEDFNKVSVAALSHCNNNIIKYNDLLEQVTNAKKLTELNQIVW
jgi:hypothetical protein